MQVLFTLIGIIGLIMFSWGGKMLLKIYKPKIIGEFKLTENETEVYFKKIGLYSICIVGSGYSNNLGRFGTIITKDGSELETMEKMPKFKFRHKGKLTTEFYHVKVENPGVYQILFKNIDDLEVKSSMLFTNRLFQKRIPLTQIDIIMKETFPSSKFIIGLLLTIFGFNISGFGFIAALNPQFF